MRQIWNRITRIAKASIQDEVRYSKAEHTINSSDDELRRIIDELNNPSTNDKKESSQRKQTKRYYSSIQAMHKAAATLGVLPDANPEAITIAYRRKILQTHPDKMIGKSAEIQEEARLQSIEINAAYQLLRELKGF